MLFQEERERHEYNDEKACKRANALEVFSDHAVIGVELGSHCGDVCNGRGTSLSFIFLSHLFS